MEMSQNPVAVGPFAQLELLPSEFSALLGQIYQGPMEKVPWGKALELIRKELRANYVTLILRSPAAERSGLMVNASEHGTTLPGEASYNGYYYSLDPFVGLPSNRVVTIDELIGRRWPIPVNGREGDRRRFFRSSRVGGREETKPMVWPDHWFR